jgi:hypothetical protein
MTPRLLRLRALRRAILTDLAANPLPPPTGDEPRWSGLVRCEVCGEELYDHPDDPAAPWLRLTCKLERVKL